MSLPSPINLLRTAYRHPLYVRHLVARKIAFLTRSRWVERHPDRDDKVPPPLGYKLVLTYKCSLRCVMCYEWGKAGWCHKRPKGEMDLELDWNTVEKLLPRWAICTRTSYLLAGNRCCIRDSGNWPSCSGKPDVLELCAQTAC